MCGVPSHLLHGSPCPLLAHLLADGVPVCHRFGINDYSEWPLELSKRDYHLQVFELFLLRVTAMFPCAALGFVFLLQVNANQCWSDCDAPDAHYKQGLEVLKSHDSDSVDAFAIDMNAVVTELQMNKSDVFLDQHHPTAEVHRRISEYIQPEISRHHHSTLRCNRTEMTMQPRFLRNSDLINRLLHASSLLYTKPSVHHGLVLAVEPTQLEVIGERKGEGRTDTKSAAVVPRCSERRLGHIVRTLFKYIAFNAVSQRNLIDPAVISTIRVVVDGRVAVALEHELVPAVLRRGFMAPQLWFVNPLFGNHSATPSDYNETGLLNKGLSCYTHCGSIKQGLCAYCGTGYCCRNGTKSGACDGQIGGKDMHTCVAPGSRNVSVEFCHTNLHDVHSTGAVYA